MNQKPRLVMALYKPKDGKLKDLEPLIRKHYPTLLEYGLATERAPFIAKSENGTFIEVFEWMNEAAAKKAHDHPAVAKIWEAMAMVCDFEKLENLPESKKMFPHFSDAFQD
jgi:hypothetical protein